MVRTQLRTTGRFLLSLKKKSVILKSNNYVVKDFRRLMLNFLKYIDKKLFKTFAVFTKYNSDSYLNKVNTAELTKIYANSSILSKVLFNYFSIYNLKLNSSMLHRLLGFKFLFSRYYAIHDLNFFKMNLNYIKKKKNIHFLRIASM